MDDERLILAVQKRCALYNKSDPHHSNREVVRLIWQDLADELQTDDVEAVKKRWVYMRDYFIKLTRFANESKSCYKKVKWPLYDLMSFLTPYIQRPLWEKVAVESNEDDSSSIKSEDDVPVSFQPSEARTTTPSPITTWQSANTRLTNAHAESSSSSSRSLKRPSSESRPFHPSKKTCTNKELLASSVDQELLHALKEHRAVDENEHFMKSLLPMMRELDLVSAMEFRIEVQKLLLHYMKLNHLKASLSPDTSLQST